MKAETLYEDVLRFTAWFSFTQLDPSGWAARGNEIMWNFWSSRAKTAERRLLSVNGNFQHASRLIFVVKFELTTYLLTYLHTHSINYLFIFLITYLFICLLSYLLHYLLTYLLTPYRGVLLDKLTGSQLVKKFPAFYRSRRFITLFTSARQLSYHETDRSSP